MSTTPAPIQSVTPEGQQVQQFAAKVRAKYPGAYDDLKDADLAKRIVTKHPEYADMLPHGFAAPETTFEKENKPSVDASGSLLGRTVRGIGRGLNDAVEGTYQTIIHPLDTAESMATQTEEHFKQGMEEPTALGKMAEFGAAVPGLGPFGKQLGERAAAGDYAGAISEGVSAAAAPSVARGIAEPVVGKVADMASGAKESVANAVRTPEGKLKPMVHQGARIAGGLAGSPLGTGGTIVGGLAGPTIADSVLPQSATGQMARDTASAIREGRAAKIPTRMASNPAAQASPPRFPGGPPAEPIDYEANARANRQAMGRSARPYDPVSGSRAPSANFPGAPGRIVQPPAPPAEAPLPGKAIRPGGRIVSPESPGPSVKGSYWSFKQDDLRKVVMSGDRDAAVIYKTRFGSLPPGAGLLTDVGDNPNRGLYQGK